MAELEGLLPGWDWHEVHRRTLPVEPEQALAAFLASPAAPDPVVRLLFRLRPFGVPDPGTVRMATDVRAEPWPNGCVLSTETRIAAADDQARRAFGRYWRVVGPFSALIRHRWLAAAEPTARATQ